MVDPKMQSAQPIYKTQRVNWIQYLASIMYTSQLEVTILEPLNLLLYMLKTEGL